MSVPLRVLAVALAAAALSVLSASTNAVAASDAPFAESTAKKRNPCVRARVGNRRVCLRVGQRCSVSRRSAYLAVKLDCVLLGGRRVLAKASPAALRQGRYIALGSSGQPTLEQALAAFDATIADLPGVNPAAGTVGPTTSGTTALRWMTEYLDDLSSAQRAMFAQAIAPSPDAQTVNIDPDGNVLDDPVPAPPPGMAARRVRARAAQVEAFKQIVREAAPRLAARGLVIRHPVTVSLPTTNVGGQLANAYPMWLCRTTAANCALTDTLPNACRLNIFPLAQGAGLVLRRQVVLHELTHCAQFESMTSLSEVGATPQWIMDGTADYSAQTLGRQWSGALGDSSWWPTWLRQPARGLFSRGYDAVGFWTLLAQTGTDVFSRIGPVVRAASAGDSQAGFTAATQGLDGRYLSDWGSTLAMVAANGPLWTFTDSGIPREGLPVQSVTNTTEVSQVFDARGGAIAAIEISADIVHITASPLTRGRLRDARDVDRPLAGRMDFCVRSEGCECPDGPQPPAARYPKLPAGATYVGVANADSSGSFTVAGESFEDTCKRPRRERPSGPAPGRSGRGLEIRNLETAFMGRISSGSCSVRGQTFVATGRGGGWRFNMRIAGATRPGSYVIPIGSGATFVTVSGPGGTFTSNRGVQGFPGGGSADLARVRVRVGKRTVTKWRISVGVSPLFVPGGNPGATIIPASGGLIC